MKQTNTHNFFKQLSCKPHIIDGNETWEWKREGEKLVGYAICKKCGAKIKASKSDK